MAGPARDISMTLAEFLTWDDGTDTRYELVDGQVRAMAPPAEAHGTIVMNLGALIRAALRAPCRVVAEAGIVPDDRDDTYFVADIAVTCAPPSAGRINVLEPRLIIEILSPSTSDHDRGRKVTAYREIPSVEEILLLSSEARRAELWRREGERWIVEDLIGDALLTLASVGLTTPLAAIYEGVEV
jgi:Uma2 family endonuclease